MTIDNGEQLGAVSDTTPTVSTVGRATSPNGSQVVSAPGVATTPNTGLTVTNPSGMVAPKTQPTAQGS